jgi:hypothetical protein
VASQSDAPCPLSLGKEDSEHRDTEIPAKHIIAIKFVRPTEMASGFYTHHNKITSSSTSSALRRPRTSSFGSIKLISESSCKLD